MDFSSIPNPNIFKNALISLIVGIEGAARSASIVGLDVLNDDINLSHASSSVSITFCP